MSKEEHIKKGGLAEKMAGFTPDPPETVWEGVSAQIGGRKSRRKIFVILAAAAGLALAITVGLSLLNNGPSEEFTVASNETQAEQREVAEQNQVSALAGQDLNISEEISVVSEEGATTNPFKEIRKNDRLEKKVKQVMQEEISSLMQEDKVLVAASDINEVETTLEKTIDAAIIDTTEKVEVKINEDSLLKLLSPDMVDESDLIQEKSGGRRTWQIGAGVSPQLSYRDVSSPIVSQNIAANNSESARMTYTGGVQISFRQSDRLTVESGVYYNKMGVNIGDNGSLRNSLFSDNMEYGVVPGDVVSLSNSMGTIVTARDAQSINNYSKVESIAEYNSLTEADFIALNSYANSYVQSFEYLEIPLNVRYKIFENSFEMQLIGGLSTNFLVGNSISAITNEESVNLGKVQDIRAVNYSGNAGLGFVFAILNNISLSVEPRFRYYLNSINQETLPSTRPYSFGLYTGVNYLF